jgi:hypothetical protein
VLERGKENSIVLKIKLHDEIYSSDKEKKEREREIEPKQYGTKFIR